MFFETRWWQLFITLPHLGGSVSSRFSEKCILRKSSMFFISHCRTGRLDVYSVLGLGMWCFFLWFSRFWDNVDDGMVFARRGEESDDRTLNFFKWRLGQNVSCIVVRIQSLSALTMPRVTHVLRFRNFCWVWWSQVVSKDCWVSRDRKLILQHIGRGAVGRKTRWGRRDSLWKAWIVLKHVGDVICVRARWRRHNLR